MFRTFKQWFLPCQENDYEPHLLRAWPVAVMLAVVVMFFGAAQLMERTLANPNSFLAAVVSSVLVDLTNFDRAEEGLHGLSVNQTLIEAARLKAADMAAKGYFAHNSPDGKTPWYWFNEAGYTFSYAGENLAVFFGDSEDVERAWMNSPGHRANILNSNFTEIGIATAEGFYQGQKTTFVVQMFGTPALAAPIATIASGAVVRDGAPSGETAGVVSGESTEIITEEASAPTAEVEVITQDDTFIAVKSDAPSVPSAAPVSMQTNLFERLIASPQTILSYVYGVLAALVGVALILLIFLEMSVQRPKNIMFALFLLIVIGALSYFSYSDVVVASAEGISRAPQLHS